MRYDSMVQSSRTVRTLALAALLLGAACVAGTAVAQDLAADDLGEGLPPGWTAFEAVSPQPTPTPTYKQKQPTPAPFENAGGDQFCSDGLDNDFNGLTDCQDPSCFGVAPCAAPVPVVSNRVGLALAGFMVFAGLIALARARRRSRL